MLLNWPARFPAAAGPSVGAGVLIIMGFGELYTSPDGINWTSRTVPAGYWSEAYRVGSYILVPNQDTSSSTDWALYSADNGATWTPIPDSDLPVDVRGFCGVATNGTDVVMVGLPNSETGAITTDVTAPWTAFTGDVLENWDSVIWVSALGLYIAHSQTPTYSADVIMTSPDGVTWTVRSTPSMDRYWGSRMAWNGSRLVLVGRDSMTNDTVILTSTNGTTWTEVDPGLSYQSNGWARTIWDGNRFIALGLLSGGLPEQGIVIYSTDGLTWIEGVITVADYPYDLIVIPGFYAVLCGAAGDEIWTSINLTVWNHVGDRPVTGNPYGWDWVLN